MSSFYILSGNCRKKRCGKCDKKFHTGMQFHLRTMLNESSRNLLPEEFVFSTGEVVTVGESYSTITQTLNPPSSQLFSKSIKDRDMKPFLFDGKYFVDRFRTFWYNFSD